jgi:cytochrome c oxidase subunit 3
MWIGLASISMLFMGLTSAYIVRQGLGGNWRAIQVPSLLWLTTAILLASSLTLELARRALKRGFDLAFNRWMLVTTGLGVGFLIGQLLTWGQLRDQGIYISTTPHSSFFYLLTGAHGVHLLGGVIALAILDFRFWIFDWRHGDRAKSKIRNPKSKMELAVDLTAVYWHFMAGLWVYLFVLLFVWL